jgi:anaerobic magnesium-protoporphyrin IX monomethyl ester cyclase
MPTYLIADAQAQTVYRALKRWQKHHSHLYDMAIDPLSAPKAIPEVARQEFHELCVMLRRHDLAFFRAVLDVVVTTDFDRQVNRVNELVEHWISSSHAFHQRITAEVERAYERAGLWYDADINPFIC